MTLRNMAPAGSPATESPPPALRRAGVEIVLASADIEALPWRPLPGDQGIREKVLWEDPDTGSHVGLMEVEPEGSMRRHLHHGALHHLYVVRGTAELAISERFVGAGDYTFVPAGTVHGIERAGPEGCTLFFLNLGA